MNGHGHGHGVLLLQDLEDEDEDLEYQTSYSTSTSTSTTHDVPSTSISSSNSFQHLSNPQNGRRLELQRTDLLQVPKNPRPLVANSSYQTNPKMLQAYPRRKSLSAEPPWNLTSTSTSPSGLALDSPALPYQNGYLSPSSNSSSMSTISLPVPPCTYDDVGGSGQRDNAITVVPSRNSLLEPNVFVGGRTSSNNNNHHHHKKHNHRKHKGRSKSPGRNSHSEGGDGGGGGGSILDRIDNSILKKFGDWSNIEDEGGNRPQIPRGGGGGCGASDNLFRSNSNNSKTTTLPYYFPKRMGSQDEEFSGNGVVNGGGGGLPKLFKNYDTVVKNSKQVLTDKSFKIALSKDNNDPNSILSEAKRTLSRFGGQDFD